VARWTLRDLAEATGKTYDALATAHSRAMRAARERDGAWPVGHSALPEPVVRSAPGVAPEWDPDDPAVQAWVERSKGDSRRAKNPRLRDKRWLRAQHAAGKSAAQIARELGVARVTAVAALGEAGIDVDAAQPAPEAPAVVVPEGPSEAALAREAARLERTRRQAALAREALESGIPWSPRDRAALQARADHPDWTETQVAEALGLSKGNVSGRIWTALKRVERSRAASTA
jgi:hypothetical protein